MNHLIKKIKSKQVWSILFSNVFRCNLSLYFFQSSFKIAVHFVKLETQLVTSTLLMFLK